MGHDSVEAWLSVRPSSGIALVLAALTITGGACRPFAASRQQRSFGNGGRLTAWELTDYDASVVRFELVPGGLGAYELRAGVIAGHHVCRASREPAA